MLTTLYHIEAVCELDDYNSERIEQRKEILEAECRHLLAELSAKRKQIKTIQEKEGEGWNACCVKIRLLDTETMRGRSRMGDAATSATLE